MKYKALLLAFLMLMPVVLIALPLTDASHVGMPGFYVNPPHTKFFGPCIKSTYFKIDVYLWNSAGTGYDIYAFDFVLDWSSINADGRAIQLVNATSHAPWTNFFTIADANTSLPNAAHPDGYHLALTAVPPSLGLFDFNASVLTLWFHIEQDVCWPDRVLGTFALTGVKISSDGTKPVEIPPNEMENDNGTYEQYSVRPNLDLFTDDPAYNKTSNTLTQKCVSHTFDIRVDLTNVTNVYGFGFLISYDPLYLETDVQKITPKATFSGPYEYTAIYVGPGHYTFGTLVAGQLAVIFVRPSEKPGICGERVPVVDIIFHSIWEANTTNTQLPTPATTTISLVWGFIMVKCNLVQSWDPYSWGVTGPGEYDSDGYVAFGNAFGYAPQWVINDQGLYLTPNWGAPYAAVPNIGLILGAAIKYEFKPSKYDLNLDCVVDVQDLKVLLPYYGQTLPAGNYGDLWAALGLVDIFDFVAIAKKFGPVDP